MSSCQDKETMPNMQFKIGNKYIYECKRLKISHNVILNVKYD